MERDAAFRPPPQPSRLRPVGCMHLGESHGWPSREGGRGHRRSRSAPLNPEVLKSSPESASRSPLSSPLQAGATHHRLGRSSGSNALATSPRQSAAQRDPSARHHRRATSLRGGDTGELLAAAAARVRGHAGGSPGHGGSPLGPMQELAVESMRRPPMRCRRTGEAEGFRAIASSSFESRGCRFVGVGEGDNCTTGGATISNDSYNSSGSSASGTRSAGLVGRLGEVIGDVGGGGGTGAPSSFPDDVVLKASCGSGDESSGRRGAFVAGAEETEELKSVVRGGLSQKIGATGGCAVSPDTRRKDDPRAPGLGKRRSSDSTLGVWDSPHYVPEGLNTDEEDFLGDRDSGDRTIYPLCVDACGGGGDVRRVGVAGKTFGAAGGSGEPSILTYGDARMANVIGLREHCSSPSDVAALLRAQARAPSGKGEGGAASSMVSRGCDSTDEDETIRAESFRAASPVGPVESRGWATLGAERSEETSTEVTMVVTPSGHRADARNVGAVGEGAFQSMERTREALPGASGEEARMGAHAGAHARAGLRGGGSAASRAGGMDSTGGAGKASAVAVIAADAASVADDVTDASGAAGGRIGHARASGAAGDDRLRECVGAGVDVEGQGTQRGPDGALPNGGGGKWDGGSEHEQARRVSLLDVYRERDSWAMENDWGELDDVCGLPGLSSDDAGTSSVVDSALHAPQLIFRQGAIDEGDVLSLLGESRAARQAEASATTETASTAERNISPLAAAVMRVSGVGASATRSNGAADETEGFGTNGTTEGHEGGSGIAMSRRGPESGLMSPSRARRNDRGRYNQGSRENGGGVGTSVVRAGSGGVGGGGGRQPVLLSLADLTAAGLEKLLRAKEGDSKMYFDPDAQRWVGEEVDLSGFEDTIPAGGSAQQMQERGSLADGVSGDGADDANVVTADDVTVDDTADECVVDLDTDADVTTNGAVAPCSVLPVAHLLPSQLDEVIGEAVSVGGVPGNSSGGHGRVSPAPNPTSSSNRRWSSGEDIYGPRVRRCASHGSQILATSPVDRRVAIGACSVQKSSGGRLLHRRTRSADRRLEASVSLCNRRTGSGSISRGAGGVKNNNEMGSSRGSRRPVPARSSKRGLEATRLSSGPSSASIPSESDSGSVVRLGEEHLVVAWDESDVLREQDLVGRAADKNEVDIAGVGVGCGDGFFESRRRSSGSVPRNRPPGHTHRRRVSTPVDWGIQCGGRRRNSMSRGDRREHEVVDGAGGDDEGGPRKAAEAAKAVVEMSSGNVSGEKGRTNVTKVAVETSTGDADAEGGRGPEDATGLTGSSNGAGEPVGGTEASSGHSASSQSSSSTPAPPPASSPAEVAGTSPPVLERESTDAPEQVGNSPGGVRWPWVAVSTASSRTLGLEGEAASGSEMGGSENSDWDQDDDFEGLPVNPEFKLTLEKPTKFGYSPSFTAPGSVGGDGGPATGMSPPGDMPPFNPGLLRLGTAPASVGAFSATLNRGSRPRGQSNGIMSVDAGSNERDPPEVNRLLESRFDSLGSTTEWDQTFTGELNISLAQANRSPVVSGSSTVGASGTVTGAAGNAASGPELPSSSQAEEGGADGGAESGPAVPEESAVKVAWEAFKAHTASGGGGGRNMGDSLRATVQAAATATSIAIEHFRKRNRSRQMREKGGGPVRRLSGPLQITLEDLEGPPATDGAEKIGSGDESGTVKASFQGPPSSAEGARFNREKMRWEGFEEPDLSGFLTSDDEEEAMPAPSPTCARLPLDAGKDKPGSPLRTGDLVGFPPEDVGHNAGTVSLSSPNVAVAVHREAETRCVGRQFGSAPVSSSSISGARGKDEGFWGVHSRRPGSPRAEDSIEGVVREGAGLGADSAGVDNRDDGVGAFSKGSSSVESASVGNGPVRVEQAGSKAGSLRSAGSGMCLSGDDVSDVDDASGDARQSRVISIAGREVLERGASEEEDDWESSFAGSPKATAAISTSALRLDDVANGSVATPPSGSEMIRAQTSPEGTTLLGRLGTAGGLACVAEGTVGLDHSGKRRTSMHRQFSPGSSAGFPGGFPRVGSMGSVKSLGSVGKGSVQGDGKHDGSVLAAPSMQPHQPYQQTPVVSVSAGAGSISSSNSPLMASSPVGLGASSAPGSFVDASQGNVQLGHDRRSGGEQDAQCDGTAASSAGGATGEKDTGQQNVFRNFVHRSIYPGPTRQGSLDAGDGDIHANLSHLTKSTEDDTVDDWGADFQDQIMLTPKKGSSSWNDTSRGHGGEEGRPDMDPPSPSGSPPEGIPRGFSPDASGRNTAVPHMGIKKGPSSRLGSTSLSPRRPQRGVQDFRGHQRLEFPSERASASVWRPSFSISLFPRRAGTVGAGPGEGLEQRPHQRGHANHSPPTSRSSLYGPSVKRITMDMMGGVIGVGSLGIAGFGGVFGVGAAQDGDGAKRADDCNSGTGNDAGHGQDGDGEAKGEGVDGDGSADDERGGEGTAKSQGRVKKDLRRKKRNRGYQTITKKEYTPMHVSTARLNPKTGLWEPVDGYAVDMSGFGTEGSDGELEAHGARKKLLSSASSAGPGSSSGNASPTRSSGIAVAGLSSPGHQSESLRRRPSSSGSTGSAGSCRGDAFDLSASDRWHLVRSELAHDLAMTSFLGEQCYSRAKKRGASFLLTSPGIASAVAKSRPRSSGRALPPTGRRNADARSHPGGDERPHGAQPKDGLRVLTGIRRSRPTSPRASGVSFSLSPVENGSRGSGARPSRPSRGAPRASQRNGSPEDMTTPPKPPNAHRGKSTTPTRALPESRARRSGGSGGGTPGSSGMRVGGETMAVSVTARGRTGPGSARAASRRRRSNSTTGAVSSSRGAENQGERGRSLLPWNWGGGTAGAASSARARSASYTPVMSRSRSNSGVPRKPGGRSLSSSRRLHEGASGGSGSERTTLTRSPPSSKDFRAGVINRERSASLGDGIHGGNGGRNSPRAARSTNAGTSNGSPWGGRPSTSIVPSGRAAPWRRLDDIPGKPFTSSPPPVPTHRVLRSPPPHPPPAIYTGADSVGGASAFEDMSKYGGLEEAILRRGAASPPPAPISPRSIRAARFSSFRRADSMGSRSRSGSTHCSAGSVLPRGTAIGTARSGGVLPELGRGSGSGTAVAAMVVATAAAAVARGRESAEEEQARVERKLERFRETAEFAAAMIRDRTLRRSTNLAGGPSQSGNNPQPSRVGHRQRAASGTSSEGSTNGTSLVAGGSASTTARR